MMKREGGAGGRHFHRARDGPEIAPGCMQPARDSLLDAVVCPLPRPSMVLRSCIHGNSGQVRLGQRKSGVSCREQTIPRPMQSLDRKHLPFAHGLRDGGNLLRPVCILYNPPSHTPGSAFAPFIDLCFDKLSLRASLSPILLARWPSGPRRHVKAVKPLI